MSEHDSKTTDFASGAVRSADASHLDFCSLPLMGLIGLARTATEGGTKYGRYNYMLGMPEHDTLNHMFRHLVMYILGDRSEPHMAHLGWGSLNVQQTSILNPDISAPHMLGPGATLTPAMLAFLEANKADLKARREAGEFDDLGNWNLADLPEIQTILDQREWLDEAVSLEPTPEEQDAWAERIAGIEKRLIDSRAGSSTPAPQPGIIEKVIEIHDRLGGELYNPANKAVHGRPKSDICNVAQAEQDEGHSAAAKPCVHACYPPSLRVETDHGAPAPGPGETWVEYEDGTRAYYPR